MFHLRVMGMMLLADDVVGGVEARGRAWGGRAPRRSARMAGTMPEVETVMRGLGDADAFDEQADGGHEVVVVQEGLAHAHEDEVDAVGLAARWRLTLWRLRTAATWPAISPAVRLRRMPSLAVRQNWQLTAQPTWLEMQMVARR